jgi:hypothetical protein
MKIEIKTVKLSEIKINPENPRRICNQEMDRLVKSLTDFPDMLNIREIVVDETMTVLGGNMRLMALRKTGAKEATAKIVRGLTDAQKREFVIKDNGSFGEWNFDLLANGWADLPLVDWGVDLPEDWLSSTAPDGTADAEPQIDRAEELNKTWKVKAGDLFQIGTHRLLCGDSTKAEDVARVMGGEKALVFSDPPYGVSIVSTDKTTGSIGFGGKLGFVGAGGMVPVNAYHPIIGDDTTATAEGFYKACLDAGMNDFVLWGGNYFTAFLPASPCWLIWDKREDIPSNNFADCEIAWTSFDKPSRIYRHLWSGLLRKGNRKDELIGRVHPTQKPVGLAVNIMQDFPSDIYFDGFLGSGSFMVAAQNVGKRMYGIEMDASYAATVLQRMTDAFPGIEIKRIKE